MYPINASVSFITIRPVDSLTFALKRNATLLSYLHLDIPRGLAVEEEEEFVVNYRILLNVLPQN